MLVLSRKHGESIRIGENVVVTVVRIGPNTVRLGITAPREMNIARNELIPLTQPQPAEACCDDGSDNDQELGGEGGGA